MEETVDVWTISQRVRDLASMCEWLEGSHCCEGQHEVTQFTRRHMTSF